MFSNQALAFSICAARPVDAAQRIAPGLALAGCSSWN